MTKFIKAVLRAIPWSFVFWVSLGVGIYLTASTMLGMDLSSYSWPPILVTFILACALMFIVFGVALLAILLAAKILYGITICALSDRFAWARMKWNEFIGEE